MGELFSLLGDPSFGFLRLAFILALLASPAFGMIGSVLVVRRISYLAGAIAHAVLSGVGFALFAQYKWGWTWLDPRLGALGAGLLAVALLAAGRRWAADREDSLISVLWSVGMAVGLLFLAATPASVDPMSYLFGNLLLVTSGDLWWVGLLDVVVLTLVVGGYQSLRALCFDATWADLRGIPAGRLYTLLLMLTAVTIVMMMSLVGIVLVVALLTLPAAAAERPAKSLGQMMGLAALLCWVGSWAGLSLSVMTDWPSGPTIIIVVGLLYLAAHVTRWR
ncbi:MAG: zinc transport system permease protein [Puniceicoccaceae bacterium 5H]|nr:MAG: zinc transport system permease protein [Puniceicoccaceae bacterium 5H]